VIGAGALGLSTALHCALAGRSVAVVERHTAGSQASGRAAGLFKSVQADELRTRLARRSTARAITLNEPVIGISVTAGRVAGVETDRRSIAAPVVVDAAGGRVRHVAGLAGALVPVAPVRH